MNNALLARLIENSTVKTTTILAKSEFFGKQELVDTGIPILNVAFSGYLNGGFRPGITLVAGPSRHFKSLLCLMAVKAFLDKHKTGVCLYYDTEFGSPPAYLDALGIDTSRVVHVPVMHLEQLKFDLTKQLEDLTSDDKVIVFVDSLGNVASKKELDDTLEEKSVADLSRAKAMKSLFRLITPQLVSKDIPFFGVAHTYETMEMYSKTIVSGGTALMYSSHTVFIITRAQEKDDKTKQILGYQFTINIEKSRYIRERSKLPLVVSFEKGISKYSGLLALAETLKFVEKVQANPKAYSRRGQVQESKEWLEAETDCAAFWDGLLEDPAFQKAVSDHYLLGASDMVQEEVVVHPQHTEMVVDVKGMKNKLKKSKLPEGHCGGIGVNKGN